MWNLRLTDPLKLLRPGESGTTVKAMPFARFGGGGGTKVEQADRYTQAQKDVLNKLAQTALPEIGMPGPSYGGQRLAEPSAFQTGAFDIAGMAPTGRRQFGQFQRGLENIATQDINKLLAPTQQYVGRLWQEDIAPSVMEQFAGMGAAESGGAARALGRAGERTALGLASTLAPYQLQAQGQQMQAIPQAAQFPFQQAGAMYGMGQMQRGLQQQPLDLAMQKWSEQQPWNNPALNFISPILGSSPYQNVGVNKPAGLGYSMLSGMAPGLGMGLGSSLFGDGEDGLAGGGFGGAMADMLPGMFGPFAGGLGGAIGGGISGLAQLGAALI